SRLCQFRIYLSLWMILNPYTYPWKILVELTEWFLVGFSGVLPIFFGIDYSGALVLSGLSVFIQYVRNLVFTMPYLPSEGVKEIVGKYPFYRFNGFPRLWIESGIPNELREEWYKRQPEVIEHFLKYYGTVGQDIVPTRIVEDYYNQSIKNPTINTSLANFDSLSTNVISSFNDVFHTDFVTNQIIPISNKLFHNF
ncbi:MAG: YggT family protein, partial [Gammaproteobacteria bacterium]